MRKLMMTLFVLFLGLSAIPCSGKVISLQPTGDSVTVQKDHARLQEIIDKARAEGANWNEAQWKASFREMMSAQAPILNYMTELQKKMEAAEKGSEEEQAEAISKLVVEVEAAQKTFEVYEKAVTEYQKICDANPIANKLSRDEKFAEEMKKEFNLPEDF